MFQFYLAIAGSFLVLLQASTTIELSKHAISICSVYVSVIGFFSLWAFERIKELTKRDNNIVSVINQNLSNGSTLDKKVLNDYEDYWNTVATTSSKWWSLTSCFATSTALIAGLVLAAGVEAYFEIGMTFVGITTLGLALFYFAAIWLLNITAGVKKVSNR